MPYTKTVADTITYTVTTPTWFCQWIVNTKGGPIKRLCHLKDENMFDLENPEDLHKIHNVLPELLDEVELAIDTWAKEGDSFAPHLLSSENIPAYLEYAKRTFR
jgi:hypothetical protein